MANNTELETLTITLNAEVGNARKNLKGVATSIKELEKAGKEADWSVFEKIKEHLQDIASVDFTNVAQSLHDVVSAFKALKITSADLKSSLKAPVMGEYNTGYLATFDYSSIKPTETVSDPEADSKIEETTEKVKTLKEELAKIAEIGSRVKSALRKIGIGAKDAGDEAKKSTSKWKKMAKQIGRIAFYRAIRRAIQLIVQAFKEGIQNIAQFDEDFNASMSEMLSSVKYLKNALGASVAPLIEMLTPLVVFLTDSLAELANTLGAVFSAVQGKDTFTKATKGAEDYAESLKKAKNARLGIDELNVISAEDDSDKFETATIGEEEKSIGETLKTLFDDIKGIITEVFGIVKEIIERIPIKGFIEDIVELIDSIKPIIDVILGLVDLLFAKTEDGVNNSIRSLIEAVSEVVKFVANIIELLNPILKIIIRIASFIINIINSALSGIFKSIEMVFETLNSILEPLFVILEDILNPVFEIVNLVFDLLEGVFGELMNWGNELLGEQLGLLGQICGRLSDVLVPVLKVITDILGVMFTAVGYVIVGVAYAIQAVVNLAKTIIDVLTFDWGSIENDWTWDLPNQILAKVKATASFATGGFPEDGLFFANHNELVGQFNNGKTAVANNEQITTGIYEAVLQAMRESGALGSKDNGNIVVEIDGREIAKTVKKYNNLDGSEIISGGARYGY